jgi:hypothetical protein
MFVEQQWFKALRCMETYRKAERVHTSRLHVFLPCLAFGTPVRFVGPVDKRTSILKELDIPHGKLVTRDVSKWKERFIGFLCRHLGERDVHEGEPKMPVVVNDYPR